MTAEDKPLESLYQERGKLASFYKGINVHTLLWRKQEEIQASLEHVLRYFSSEVKNACVDNFKRLTHTVMKGKTGFKPKAGSRTKSIRLETDFFVVAVVFCFLQTHPLVASVYTQRMLIRSAEWQGGSDSWCNFHWLFCHYIQSSNKRNGTLQTGTFDKLKLSIAVFIITQRHQELLRLGGGSALWAHAPISPHLFHLHLSWIFTWEQSLQRESFPYNGYFIHPKRSRHKLCKYLCRVIPLHYFPSQANGNYY